MHNCINDAKYKGNEPSHKRYDYCTHSEKYKKARMIKSAKLK